MPFKSILWVYLLDKSFVTISELVWRQLNMVVMNNCKTKCVSLQRPSVKSLTVYIREKEVAFSWSLQPKGLQPFIPFKISDFGIRLAKPRCVSWHALFYERERVLVCDCYDFCNHALGFNYFSLEKCLDLLVCIMVIFVLKTGCITTSRETSFRPKCSTVFY